jgi:hypothetical protein
MPRIRRVVTGINGSGRPAVLIDDQSSRTCTWTSDPAASPNIAWIWASDDMPSVPFAGGDPTHDIDQFLPPRGGIRFTIQTYEPGFGVGAAEELTIPRQALRDAGFRTLASAGRGSFHATSTVDLAIVLSGEIWLLLEGQEEVKLAMGDCLVQNGVIHAWQNRSSEPCTIGLVIIGASRIQDREIR